MDDFVDLVDVVVEENVLILERSLIEYQGAKGFAVCGCEFDFHSYRFWGCWLLLELLLKKFQSAFGRPAMMKNRRRATMSQHLFFIM